MTHECPPLESVVADIERHGLSIMLVDEDEDGPRFAFSVGLYHSFKHPEIIVFGLKHEVAGWIINELARRIKTGERCEVTKEYAGLLGGYKCVFRETPKGCYPDYFGYAMAFYSSDDFPALQLVWPDKENKWPWEMDFNHSWIWHQPLLEHWPDQKIKSHWIFDEPRNLGVFTTRKVLYEKHPILLVTHDEDEGDWQFLCRTTNDSNDCRLVCLKEIVELDPGIEELADLPVGWEAWREQAGAAWRRKPKN